MASSSRAEAAGRGSSWPPLWRIRIYRASLLVEIWILLLLLPLLPLPRILLWALPPPWELWRRKRTTFMPWRSKWPRRRLKLRPRLRKRSSWPRRRPSTTGRRRRPRLRRPCVRIAPPGRHPAAARGGRRRWGPRAATRRRSRWPAWDACASNAAAFSTSSCPRAGGLARCAWIRLPCGIFRPCGRACASRSLRLLSSMLPLSDGVTIDQLWLRTDLAIVSASDAPAVVSVHCERELNLWA